ATEYDTPEKVSIVKRVEDDRNQCQQAVEAILRGGERPDELRIVDHLHAFLASPSVGHLMQSKGFDKSMLEPVPGAFADDADGGSGQQQEPALSGKDLREKEFWDRVKAGGFFFKANARGGNAIASRFERARKRNDEKGRQLAADYAACAGDEEKAKNFRQKWAEGEYNTYVKSRTLTTTYKKTTIKTGWYLPLGRVVHKEGGG
ncbi:unnamed protein product, partial [Prorocentrum cordatum]